MSEVKKLQDEALIDETSASGTPVQRKGKTPRQESAPVNPKTSGAAVPEPESAKSSIANRNPGPRQAGATPRPTDKPIVGGDRG